MRCIAFGEDPLTDRCENTAAVVLHFWFPPPLGSRPGDWCHGAFCGEHARLYRLNRVGRREDPS